MSSCNKTSQLLSAYVDGKISASEKEMVEKHIENCTSCKQKLEVMIKTKDILKATPQIPVPETLLKDFDEYRKKSEQTEKKVVPFYKNYRVYASVAAIFIFAFVLKSGLWQEDKFVPDTLSQSTVTEQTLNAPVTNNTENPKEDPVVAKKEAVVTNAKEKQLVKQAEPVKEQQVQNDVVQTESVEPAPASEDAEATSGGAAYDESQGFSLARSVDAPADESEVAIQATVYVDEKNLEKATMLLADGEFFFAQVEQKLSDNMIPYESNFLSLDEGVPHKIVVLVKE